MKKQLQTATIADLRNDHLSVLAKLEAGPVTLNNYSNRVAVMVAPKHWDQLMELLEDQGDIIDALDMHNAIGKGEVEMMTQKEIQAWLAEDDDLSENEELIEDQRVPA